jgi:hypothetical protein
MSSRKWAIGFAIVVFVAGMLVAILLPDGTTNPCQEPDGLIPGCQLPIQVDTRIGLRLIVIAATTLISVIIAASARRLGGPTVDVGAVGSGK